MTEIVAAHLERVARERVLKLSADLADLAANRVVTPMCPSINIEVARDFVAQFKPIVAAALMACAREEHDFLCVPCANAMRAKCPSQRCGRGAALERAVGEKGQA